MDLHAAEFDLEEAYELLKKHLDALDASSVSQVTHALVPFKDAKDPRNGMSAYVGCFEPEPYDEGDQYITVGERIAELVVNSLTEKFTHGAEVDGALCCVDALEPSWKEDVRFWNSPFNRCAHGVTLYQLVFAARQTDPSARHIRQTLNTFMEVKPAKDRALALRLLGCAPKGAGSQPYVLWTSMRTGNGCVPLINIAVRYEDDELIRLLCSNRDLRAEDVTVPNAVQIAKTLGRLDLAELLTQAGLRNLDANVRQWLPLM